MSKSIIEPEIPLLPCPFCGSLGVLTKIACKAPKHQPTPSGLIGRYFVVCANVTKCGCGLLPVYTSMQACKAWNRRLVALSTKAQMAA